MAKQTFTHEGTIRFRFMNNEQRKLRETKLYWVDADGNKFSKADNGRMTGHGGGGYLILESVAAIAEAKNV
jgi:hypothetical protein